jgi:methyl-accepting chemotaxis protein
MKDADIDALWEFLRGYIDGHTEKHTLSDRIQHTKLVAFINETTSQIDHLTERVKKLEENAAQAKITLDRSE